MWAMLAEKVLALNGFDQGMCGASRLLLSLLVLLSCISEANDLGGPANRYAINSLAHYPLLKEIREVEKTDEKIARLFARHCVPSLKSWVSKVLKSSNHPDKYPYGSGNRPVCTSCGKRTPPERNAQSLRRQETITAIEGGYTTGTPDVLYSTTRL
ncbi:hypothetical protein BKA70DRAFT_1410303 [Coprinopsis sp. MPI-PUGE-AT-0042]|nr:hypothetical protein BKA70DRAFT_1410303 [Coprinopsis sp. MPI-PUGE-AT-0042]